MTLGEKIRKLRQEKNVPMVELARVVGISKGAIGHIETGVNNPSQETLKKISKYLEVSTDYLLNEGESIVDRQKIRPVEDRVSTLEAEMISVKNGVNSVVMAVNQHSLSIIDLQRRMLAQAPHPVVTPEEFEKHAKETHKKENIRGPYVGPRTKG